MIRLLDRIGRTALARVREALAIAELLYAAAKGAVLERPRGQAVVRRATLTQVYFTAVEPLSLFLVIAVVCGFFAIVLSDSLMRPNGLAPHIPLVVAQSVVRELVPLVIALIVIGRSGPAIATELGYMRVNHEVEALELSGINIDYFLVLPRVVGVTAATIGLTVAMSAAALVGGYLLGQVVGLVSVGLELDQILEAVTPATVLWALLKALLFGLVISVVNCFHGLAVGRSFTEIPRANVRGAVQCYVVCFCLDAVIALWAATGGA
jgi:phospholipid/cholesterol/gamma-HCH transport system permease protein